MPEDVASLFHDALRHRVVLSYEALAADASALTRCWTPCWRPSRSSRSSASAAAVRSSEGLLRRVELRVGRRLDGILQGERRGRRPGPGAEPALTRAYEPGDDVRWVDWPLSARLGEPMVRVPEIEPVLTAWALVDCSPSMAFGSTVQRKLDLARRSWRASAWCSPAAATASAWWPAATATSTRCARPAPTAAR